MTNPRFDEPFLSRLSAFAAEQNTSVEAMIEGWMQFFTGDERATADSAEVTDKHTAFTTTHEAMQAALQERAHLAMVMADHISDVVCLHAPDGTYLYVSPSSKRMLGYDPDEMVGTNPIIHVHPDDLAMLQAHRRAALQSGTSSAITYRFQRKDNEYICLETHTTIVLGQGGSASHLVSVSRDVTEQVRVAAELKAERDLLSSMMDTSPSGIVVVDNKGKLIFSNRRADQILGSPRESENIRTYDSASWKQTDYDGNPWLDEQQPFVRVMKTRKPVWDVRHAIELQDGRKVYLSINGAPILDEQGEVSKVVFTIEDYTLRKLQEDELDASLKREQQLNEMKSVFISMVTHEFRTPMTVIMTSTGLLRMKYGRMSEEEFLSRLNRIDAHVRHLNALLSDVTFINKAERYGHAKEASTDLTLIDLPQFFAHMVEEIHMAYPDHQRIQIAGEGSVISVRLNLILFQQIVVNLLSNAVKYSPPESAVLCHYICTQTSLTLSIHDKGIGIPPEDQTNLFSPFYRATNVGGVSGTGLGLAIVKRAVDAMKGEITFESAVGMGTTFVISLPLGNTL